MTYQELATITGKKPQTIAMFFSRHGLSIKSPDAIRFYIDYAQRGKRIEQGKRPTAHLKKYQFKPRKIALERARELLEARQLIWSGNAVNLSLSSIVEHVLMYGDFEDYKELERILGKKNVRDAFREQISRRRTNYRPQTLNFFKHYFNLA